MFGYANDLRSATQGRASYSMEFSKYTAAPKNVADDVIEKLKEAQVVPLFKKNNSLDKCNNRPVSILPTISKFYERAIYEQTVTFFDKVFHPSLSAFRSGLWLPNSSSKNNRRLEKGPYMSSHSLIILPILTHCFLLER
jgi:hypothetical protein